MYLLYVYKKTTYASSRYRIQVSRLALKTLYLMGHLPVYEAQVLEH